MTFEKIAKPVPSMSRNHLRLLAMTVCTKQILLSAIFISFALQALSCATDQTAPPEKLSIHFIDVGEGDAILIRTSKECILVDTGNPITGVRLLRYLQKQHIGTIGHIILTHPHPDHMGGIFAIAQLIPFYHIYDNGEDINRHAKEQPLFRWYRDLVRENPKYEPLGAGNRLHFNGITLTVLWPPKSRGSADWNTGSLVCMLEFGTFRCLLMGDGNRITEGELLKRGVNLKAHILKAGHHGALDTATVEFIEAVKPETVIISVNKGNINGYPADKVIQRYTRTAKVYRTYRDGTIVVTVFPDGRYAVQCER